MLRGGHKLFIMQDDNTANAGNLDQTNPNIAQTNPGGSQPGNLDRSNGVDNVDYKARYSESTREAQRILEENRQLKEQIETQKPYVEVGTQFTLKYENDPEFRGLIDSATQKQAEGKPLNADEKAAIGDANATEGNVGATLDPELLAYIKQKRAEDAQTSVQKQQRFASLIQEIEADKSSEIDKHTERYVDPETKQVVVSNPVRLGIAAAAKAIQSIHGVDEETAYRKAAKILLKEEEMFEEAEYKGQLNGLQSQSVTTYGGSKGLGRRPEVDPGALDDKDREIIKTYGSSIDADIYSDIKRRSALLRNKQF